MTVAAARGGRRIAGISPYENGVEVGPSLAGSLRSVVFGCTGTGRYFLYYAVCVCGGGVC